MLWGFRLGIVHFWEVVDTHFLFWKACVCLHFLRLRYRRYWNIDSGLGLRGSRDRNGCGRRRDRLWGFRLGSVHFWEVVNTHFLCWKACVCLPFLRLRYRLLVCTLEHHRDTLLLFFTHAIVNFDFLFLLRLRIRILPFERLIPA